MDKQQATGRAPLKRSKNGTPMRKVSSSRAREMRLYYEERAEWLKAHPACMICLVRGMTPAPATEVHHRFGRVGSLLRDQRGWCASCVHCRDWPHANPREARELGVLGPPELWNVRIDRHPAS